MAQLELVISDNGDAEVRTTMLSSVRKALRRAASFAVTERDTDEGSPWLSISAFDDTGTEIAVIPLPDDDDDEWLSAAQSAGQVIAAGNPVPFV